MKLVSYGQLRQVLKNNVRKSCHLQLVAVDVYGNVASHETSFEYCNKTTLLKISRLVRYAISSWAYGWELQVRFTVDNVNYTINTTMF